MSRILFSRKDVEEIVERLLKKLRREGITPPFDQRKLKKVAELFGIEIEERSMGYFFHDDPSLPLEEQYPLDGKIEILKTDNGEKVKIIINADRPTKRANFTIAHELGHYFLHYLLGFRDIPKDTMYTFNRKVIYDSLEREANWFAVALLMPSNMVIEEWKKINSSEYGFLSLADKIREIANKFHVSQLAMKYRLQELNIL